MPSASLYVAVPVPNSVCTDDTVSGSLPRGPRSEEVSTSPTSQTTATSHKTESSGHGRFQPYL